MGTVTWCHLSCDVGTVTWCHLSCDVGTVTWCHLSWDAVSDECYGGTLLSPF